ncbi:histidine kinase [Nonomuraea sp. 3-1Str]|uniref:sensor histidine kinase n=1 Tax=Nonomuraea sp. 3-1Str TaxID=2929801 RepID=UPI00285ED593|nr:histidine kinase [Nonomuraea sp. 3-1Str]MDR8413197.1 histidine kinase [Nonomuraea sp. 3-1Str]
MHHDPPRPPLTQRLPPGARTALTWCAVAVFALVLFVTLLNQDRDVHPEAPAAAAAAAVMALPLAGSRRRPSAVLAVLLAEIPVATAAGVMADRIWPVFLAADILTGLVTAGRARRAGVVAAVAALAVQQAAWQFDLWRGGHRALAPGFVGLTLVLALGVLVAWLAGTSIRQRREYGRALRAHATAEAVTAERLRIARELHDMVAHSIGVIAIQAGAGARVMDAEPAKAREALTAIETTSRETLRGLRSLLGVLRRPEPRPAEPAPFAGLADLDAVVAMTAAAGVRVDVRWSGERRPLPAAVDRSAFRIVQEAVTNVVRHAGVARCAVSIDFRDEELRVEIVDAGHGPAPAAPPGGGGYGIAGMRERVALLDGDLSAGPRPGGGFRVAARLPVPDRPDDDHASGAMTSAEGAR